MKILTPLNDFGNTSPNTVFILVGHIIRYTRGDKDEVHKDMILKYYKTSSNIPDTIFNTVLYPTFTEIRRFYIHAKNNQIILHKS